MVLSGIGFHWSQVMPMISVADFTDALSWQVNFNGLHWHCGHMVSLWSTVSTDFHWLSTIFPSKLQRFLSSTEGRTSGFRWLFIAYRATFGGFHQSYGRMRGRDQWLFLTGHYFYRWSPMVFIGIWCLKGDGFFWLSAGFSGEFQRVSLKLQVHNRYVNVAGFYWMYSASKGEEPIVFIR